MAYHSGTNGIPLKPLDEIFHLYNRTVTKYEPLVYTIYL